jgi:Na+-transporting methylmalonyl-CoA/oxaloacetate decarboxylase gamma subunit
MLVPSLLVWFVRAASAFNNRNVFKPLEPNESARVTRREADTLLG